VLLFGHKFFSSLFRTDVVRVCSNSVTRFSHYSISSYDVMCFISIFQTDLLCPR
jgi:hypothetical protein